MKDFEPSRYFVQNTMVQVRAAAQRRQTRSGLLRAPLVLAAVECGAALGGVLLGLATLARLYLAVFAPAVCH